VQHRNVADLGAEMFGIGDDRAQRLGGRLEQDGVDDRRDLDRQREDDVEIGYRQELALACGDPVARRLSLAPGTMPVATRVIRDADRAAGLAALDMAAEGGGAAQFDRAHHPPLDAAEMSVIALPIGFAVSAAAPPPG
jgi:hypothetical protein